MDEELQKALKTLTDQSDKIDRALFGEPDLKKKGIIDRFEEHDVVISELLAIRDKGKFLGKIVLAVLPMVGYLGGKGVEHAIIHIEKLLHWV